MKTTIKKITPLKEDPYFAVYAEGETSMIACFKFRDDAKDEDVYNKDLNYQSALKLAKRIEATGITKETEEIVYQTPNENEQH